MFATQSKKHYKLKNKDFLSNKIKFLSKLTFFTKKKNNKNNKNNKNLKNYLFGLINYLFDFSFNHNKKLLVTVLILLIIGIIFTFSATISFSYWYSPNRNEYFFLINHLRTLILGILLVIPILFIKVDFLFKLWPFTYTTCFFLLLYLTYLSITGQAESIDGATRWINMGYVQFQPSEFIKLGLVLSLPSIFKLLNKISQNTKLTLQAKIFWFVSFNLSFFLILILILGTKNLGNAIIIGCIGITGFWFVSKTKIEKVNLVIITFILILGGVVFGIVESYRAERINVWLTYLKTGDTLYPNEKGELSRENKSYQLDQSLISIGSGGISGKGLGNSIGKYYLPKTSAGDDSIFAVIAEELGFVFTIPIILIYLYLIFQLLKTAQKQSSNTLIACTLILISIWIWMQTFVHIGANVGILPLTGQTLPFISTGGSSIISLIIAIALALNLSRYETKQNTSNSTSFQ